MQSPSKGKILCKDHKFWKKISHLFWLYHVISKKMGEFFKLLLHLLSIVKQMGNFFFQIFVPFSEKLNFTKDEPSLKVTFFAVLEMKNQPKL